MTNITMIDFEKFNGPVYTGRARGERARSQLQLDQVDEDMAFVEVKIPDNTYTVSSSFFLGLFGPSVLRAGSKEAFLKRFHFHNPQFLKSEIDAYIARALQGRNLFS